MRHHPEPEVMEEGSVRSAQICDRTRIPKAKRRNTTQSSFPSISKKEKSLKTASRQSDKTTCSKSKRSHKRDNYGKVKGRMNSSTRTSDSERTSASKSGLQLILAATPGPSRAQITLMAIMLSILANQQVPDKAGRAGGAAHEGHAHPYWK